MRYEYNYFPLMLALKGEGKVCSEVIEPGLSSGLSLFEVFQFVVYLMKQNNGTSSQTV